MASNNEISRLFGLYGELLLLHNEEEQLADMLGGAAYRIRQMPGEVMTLSKKELLKNFRPEVYQVLNQLQKTGSIEALDELIQLTPPGLFEMMRIRGLGGKKLSVLWKTAGIDNLNVLLEACKKNKLISIPGFGLKTQENIIAAIEAYTSNKDRFYYAEVADAANVLLVALQETCKTKLIDLCGEIRRQATTVASIELIAAIEPKKLVLKSLRKWLVVQSSNNGQTIAHTLDEVPVLIYHTTPDKYFYELFKRTGNEGHVKKIVTKIKNEGPYDSEEAIYKKAKLPHIDPALREDVAEWNFVKKRAELVTAEDIKGVVHNHTTWSDGVNTLSDFVNACKKRGYEYVIISDHSKNAHYAGGLKEEQVLLQIKEIDALNKKLAPFRIFKSIECDILVSGALDFETSLLQQFNLVIVSIHQLLKMDEEKATRRLIKAIENPYTTILGHMTGRQLLIRPGYPVNHKKIIDACAANKVIIEINANPYRLDMDWSHIPYALEKGVMISVNPDAHSIAEIDNIRWGVAAARKGGLTKEMTWNALSLKGIDAWLQKRRRF